MQCLLLFSLLFSCLLSPQSRTVTLDTGEVTLPKGYSNKRVGMTDSLMGEIRRADGTLVIYCDIGAMAGTHMYPQRRGECVWFRERLINGRKAFVGLVENRGKRELIVTIMGGSEVSFTLPANFWAEVRSRRDMADVERIAASYKPKPKE